MRLKFSLLLLIGFIQSLSFAQIKTPLTSPAATISQVIGFTDIKIEYNRPQLKERDLYKDLTREGAIWRTGANMCTRLTLTDEIYIEDNLIPQGNYSLYSMRTGDDWTLIINKKISWGTTYDEKEDFLRIKVPVGKYTATHESHTFYFSNVTEETGILGFAWGEANVEFKLRVGIHENILAEIDKVMKNEKNAPDEDFRTASNYYMKKGLDAKKALHWALVFVDERGNNKLHFHVGFKADALLNAGRKKEALAAYKIALKKAIDTKKDDAIYNYKKKIAELEE